MWKQRKRTREIESARDRPRPSKFKLRLRLIAHQRCGTGYGRTNLNITIITNVITASATTATLIVVKGKADELLLKINPTRTRQHPPIAVPANVFWHIAGGFLGSCYVQIQQEPANFHRPSRLPTCSGILATGSWVLVNA